MEVSALSPRVAFLDHHRSLLTVGNSHLKQRIAALAQDKIFKDGTRSSIFIILDRTICCGSSANFDKIGVKLRRLLGL
jgi:hypothetical protein